MRTGCSHYLRVVHCMFYVLQKQAVSIDSKKHVLVCDMLFSPVSAIEDDKPSYRLGQKCECARVQECMLILEKNDASVQFCI